ncbi:hybrid sensor histidine kinase/response regulator [Butyrivibrio sp. AE3004]|uniref:hybrid sensor histidine kinase/response regulator n=1 Tax=Butyrivibrio sp. AE3004 TaxID=1506994 RepID=UPI000690E664|nr:response regulator [Butyrivibrio sp. AE3004]
MKVKNSNNLIKIAIISGIIVAFILVFGTIFNGRSASSDTEAAVRNVSLLYLDELAARREQVVTATLNTYISNLKVATGLIGKSDLESVEALQDYQIRMKQLYNLEKFAFVDENGLIYTSKGTRTDIDQYDFDYQTLSGPEISIKTSKKEDMKLIVAIPVDRLPFENHTLLACFMEMDMSIFLEGLSLGGSNNSTTFCNIYTTDGTSLTNIVLGGLASESNLIHALKNAEFEKGYSVEKISNDFTDRNRGVVSFTYNGIKETLTYIPVHKTDWILTYLIRESVISEQIKTISNGIVFRSLFMSGLIAIVLTTVFIIFVIQIRKNDKLMLEKETSEVLQQELEERISLQDELLEQEEKRKQQDKMITALASDYRSVYYIDLDKDDGVCYRSDSNYYNDVKEGEHFKYSTAFKEYASNYVGKDYLEGFLDFIKPENIKKNLEDEAIIAYRYLVIKDGKESYEMLRMAGVTQSDENDEGDIHAVGVGFTDIDLEMRDNMSKNQALSDALKAAEEASKAKTVFLSNMSHEIRTPMNAIIGLDTLALHEPNLTEQAKDYLEKIGSSAQHLLSLINDILDMSRIESGRMVIKNEEFSFSQLIEQINIIFSSQCQDKGLDYNCNIKGELSDYYIGDSIKLRQVLVNILGNAVKFTNTGGKVDFSIEKIAGVDGKSSIQFKISDTGIGMSQEFLPKLFDTFSQENSGTSNQYGSSGLGMAISKSIIEMMNGKISVESKKGVGTTFTVTVTVIDSDRENDTYDNEIEIRPQDMNVLIIDDDQVALDHARLILGQAGINTEIALSGKAAIEMIKLHHARREPYNLIIVDWKMPEMDGIETTRQIREIIGDESAIIILTAYNWDEVLNEALEAGVDSFIAKPLLAGHLIEEIRNAFKRKNVLKVKEVKKADLEGKRILIAEDMAVNSQILMKVLALRKIESELAVNGKIALDMFKESKEGYYDAILMDMRMPEMDGLTATMNIRKIERADAKTIPIVALTANAFDEDVQKSLQAGLNAHLSKPVQPEVLFETLENLIQE